jgi:hypothetical protein
MRVIAEGTCSSRWRTTRILEVSIRTPEGEPSPDEGESEPFRGAGRGEESDSRAQAG